MEVLSYGYKKPEDGDSGAIFYPALAFNIERVNTHSHNGSDSAKISTYNLTPTTATITSAGWTSVGDGLYRQAVSMPALMSFDNRYILFKDSATYENLLLTTERIDASSYYVYSNDNTLSLIALYV